MPHQSPSDLRPVVSAADEALAGELLARMRGRPARVTTPPQAGALAAKVLRPLQKASGGALSLPELQRQWREIVGDKLAQMTEPEKITRTKSAAVLTLKVAGPAAPFVQHQIPLLLERCNLAGAALTDIQVRQGVIQRPQSNLRPISAPLSADQEVALEAGLAAIGDANLKAALLKLGRAVQSR